MDRGWPRQPNQRGVITMINDKGELIITLRLEDVKGFAAERGNRPISDQQARKVLEDMDRSYDCCGCVGINWDVIDYHIDSVLKETL